ncbi:MAG: sigma-70 family RNA polymerase sigma factor [Sphingobacteriaceae bacterium]|nr:MAG: sigma-70 family RNA polymerase sigma factor [Sphingobacteriaceae bacterium]
MAGLPHLTDNQLIETYTAGNVSGIETLVNRYKDKIFSSIYFMVKDKYLAEDLFQDVFIKIIDTIRQGRYQEEGKFLPWAMRIAYNMCVDHFRKVKRSPTIKTTDGNDLFSWILVDDTGADTAITKRQTYDRVRTMLDLLPEEQKEVIVLRHYADLSFKEIAAMTNCSINTALGRMRYGLINLRKMMVEKQIAL